MPSFDVVSQVDQQEVRNAVDQANRELATRFDFKNTNAKFTLEDHEIVMRAPNEFQLRQMYDVLTKRLVGRQVDIRCLELDAPQVNVSEARQPITVRQGVESEMAREIVKLVKAMKLKVQVAIQGDQLRVTGKKRDELQQVINILKEAKLDLPLQFENYRD
ncbi:MAG: YajQ family cyclic di-GMP-binding protein [Acidobacteriota bacterium]|nr:YajQ family cyclic di-GMP-binding protein [Acidobacteriota bacterium]